MEEDNKRTTELFQPLEEGSIIYGAEPEYNLLWAILLKALLDACGTTSENLPRPIDFRPKAFPAGRRAAAPRDEARRWIRSNKWVQQRTGFNFLYICEMLRIDPGRIRAAVERHQDDWTLARMAQTSLSYEAVVRKFIGGASND